MPKCTIFLENNEAQYTSGSEIRGNLRCYFHTETTIRGIKIRLKCKEYNKMKRGKNNRVRRKTIFEDKKILFGYDSGSDETITVPPGTCNHPFTFTLPRAAPSSFKGNYHGLVYYKIKSAIDIPFNFDDTDEKPIEVFSPVDFNTLPLQLQEARTYSNEKTMGFCCYQGELAMSVELPKLAFLVGETVNCKVAVSNMSTQSVTYLQVHLKKIVESSLGSKYGRKRREYVDDIVVITEHGVGAHNLHTFDIPLTIPQTVKVYNFTGCTMFNEIHKLKVTCAFEGFCTSNLDIAIRDIVLGHIPPNYL